ncbi:MAG: TIGR00296 family protein [Candidatus Thermoplasmatota archaeon]|nr:TIGR00296 family protein [Candidatus Thermoplasmatota archaeon]
MDLKDGEKIVEYARAAVESYVNGESRNSILKRAEQELQELVEERGVFVTISTFPEKELRGCIGYPEPVYPLNKALALSTIAAATEDPRFPPVSPSELNHIVFEVTILTKPQKIEYNKPEELPERIKVGRDGLIAEKGYYRGLLLPQVPVEWGWDAEEFLSQTCWKAGLPKNEWKKGAVSFYKFEGEIFAEKEVKGRIERITPELSHQ